MTDTTPTVLRSPRWPGIISDVFSPLLIPTYAMTLAMWITPLRVLPESGRLVATGVVAFLTALVPLMTIMLLIRLGKVADRAISDRRQRFLPYSVAIVCYGMAAWTMRTYHAPGWLSMFFVGGAVATAAAMIITTVWKISAHATAAGGLVGMLAWFAISGLADVGAMLWLSGGVILAGLIATARLALSRHTLGQVVAGLVLGFAATLGMMAVH